MKRSLLVESLGMLACPQCACTGRWDSLSGPSMRKNSMTAVARCRVCGDRVFLKEVLPSSVEQNALNDANREFETMKRLQSARRSFPLLRVAVPLAQFGTVLVFEFVEGRSLLCALRSSNCSETLALMDRTGSWFASFHEAGGVSRRDADLHAKYSALCKRCRTLAPTLGIVENTLIWLNSELPEFTGRTLDEVYVHGDAKPDNFLIQGSELVGYDISWRFRNAPEYDLAQFVVQLLIAHHVVAIRTNEALRREFRQAFINGYQRVRGLDTRAMAWLEGYFLVSFWMSMRERGPVHRLCRDPLFKRLAAIHLAEAGSRHRMY